MDLYEVLDQIVDLLRQRGKVTYSALKFQFQLDDEALAVLKEELLYAQPEIEDDKGRGLIWQGTTDVVSTPPPASDAASPSAIDQERDPVAYTPAHLADKIRHSRSALEGERKQVTILFADIKDSTELIKDLDPEDAQQLLDPAIHIMMDAVHRFEGTVNQVLGDGIMSIFGAPIAHEDHALRACYAALAMQNTMRNYTEDMRRTHGIPLQIRAGLNSGEVVVRTISSDLHMDYSAVGQATHLAARMEQLATPGSIVLSSATLRLVEGLIQVNALGPIPIKGMTAPVEVFELTGASSIRRRLQAAVARGLTQFVGRDTELEALNQALKQAGSGQGQIVAAVGEAGVGKSRLVYEFIHSHQTQGWRVLESASVSYGKATPYFPVIDLLKRYCHVDDGDKARTIRAKVTGQVLTLDEILQDALPALLALLGVVPNNSPFLHLEPPQRRRRTLDGLKRMLLRESQVQPLLLVFEDLHWIDSETQALLDSLVESLTTAQLLLMVNYRPDYQHGWGSKTYYTQLRLDPLPPASADALLQALLGDDPSLVPLKQLLIERTAGNPFFLEEIVRTLVETGVLVGELGNYRLVHALPTVQVPATVQTVLAARIDQLPPEAKRLLQTAAVIGSEVPLPLLQAIAELPEVALHGGLAHLQAAEFLYETRLFPEREYTFKHALTHEVAYSTLLQERRRVLHAQIVAALEALSPDRGAEQVERLAHHALRGEVWPKALEYLRQAGQLALERSAYREAVASFERALEAMPHLPQNRTTLEQAIDLRLTLRTALRPLGDLGRILAVLREAESLAVTLDDPRRLGRVSIFLSIHFRFMGEYDHAIAAGQRALTLATASSDGVMHALANQYLGMIYQTQGDYRRAIDCYEQTIAYFDGVQRHERFGATLPPVTSRAHLAWSHAELGAFPEGSTFGDEGLQIAEAVNHPASLLVALLGSGLLALRQGNLPSALPLLERAVSICQDTDHRSYFPRIAAPLGVAYTLSGRVTNAVALLTQALEQTKSTELFGDELLCRLSLGEAQLLAGDLEEAHALAEGVLTLTRKHQERGNQAYALRLLGDIAARRDPPEIDLAEAHYQHALALADELGMRPLQAHCHCGLGTLYGLMGWSEQARAELSTAIDMYRDMEMVFWLPQAEVALTQVA